MSNEVPKKFYRNVVRGVSYYTQEKKRACKLDELVAYVYLKNSRALPASRIQPIVEKALADLCKTGLIEKIQNNYKLSDQLVGGRTTTTRREASPRRKRSAKTRKASRTRVRPAVEAMEGAPEPGAGDPQEEESEDEDEEDYDSEAEVLPHRPLKVEKEETNEQDPAVTTPATASTSSKPENETEQGSSSAEGSSAWSWFKFW